MKRLTKSPLTCLIVGFLGTIIGLYIESYTVMILCVLLQMFSVLLNIGDGTEEATEEAHQERRSTVIKLEVK